MKNYRLVLILLAFANYAYSQTELPEPLNLSAVMAYAQRLDHPMVQQLQHALEVSLAQQVLVRSESGFKASVFGSASLIEPSALSPNQDTEDYMAGFSLNKRIVDFGESRHRIQAQQEMSREQQYQLAQAKNHYLILVMERYFAVILADLRYRRDNEAMAVAYVRFDKAKDRRRVGKISDIEVLDLETVYQKVRRQRLQSESQQNFTRLLLASALNTDSVAKNLQVPKLDYLRQKLPEWETLVPYVLKHNPELLAIQARIEATRNQLLAHRRGRLPKFDVAVETWYYNRDLGSRDKWRAGIQMQWPLWQGGGISAKSSRSRALLQQYQAEYQLAVKKINKQGVQILNRLKLLNAKAQELQVLRKFRDLKLDQHRALYELEVQTDLGDAMVQLTDVDLQSAENQFALALSWARLQALVGLEVALREWRL